MEEPAWELASALRIAHPFFSADPSVAARLREERECLAGETLRDERECLATETAVACAAPRGQRRSKKRARTYTQEEARRWRAKGHGRFCWCWAAGGLLRAPPLRCDALVPVASR